MSQRGANVVPPSTDSRAGRERINSQSDGIGG
jgi:hypothetical protein